MEDGLSVVAGTGSSRFLQGHDEPFQNSTLHSVSIIGMGLLFMYKTD